MDQSFIFKHAAGWTSAALIVGLMSSATPGVEAVEISRAEFFQALDRVVLSLDHRAISGVDCYSLTDAVYTNQHPESSPGPYLLGNPDDTAAGFQYKASEDPADPWFGLRYWEGRFLVHDDVSEPEPYAVRMLSPTAFQFFHDGDLNIHSGPTQTFNGRLHANQDVSLWAASGLQFAERITAAGRYYRGLSAGVPGDGRIDLSVPLFPEDPMGASSWIGDRLDTLDPAQPYLDSGDEGWTSRARERWKYQLQDGSHNVTKLLFSGSALLSPYQRLDRLRTSDPPEVRRLRHEYSADLVIVGDPGAPSTWRMHTQQRDDASTEVFRTPVSSSIVTDCLSSGQFYDGHQQTIVRTLEVNMGKIVEHGLLDAEESGIIYTSTTPVLGDEYLLAPGNRDPEYRTDTNGDVIYADPYTPSVTSGAEGWMTPVATSNTAAAKQHYMPAVALVNAERFPVGAAGTGAFFTDRPLYTIGGVATLNEPGTILIGAESLTALSQPLWLAELDLDASGEAGNERFDSSADGLTILNPPPAGYTTATGCTRWMGRNWRSSSDYRWDLLRPHLRATQDIDIHASLMIGDLPRPSDPHPEGQPEGIHRTIRHLEDLPSQWINLNGSLVVPFASPVTRHMYRISVTQRESYFSLPRRNLAWPHTLSAIDPAELAMPAVFEFRHGAPDAPVDTDGDGRPDACEATDDAVLALAGTAITHLLISDSDGDGLKDGEESAFICASQLTTLAPTNPRNPDSDGDGFGDGIEVLFLLSDPLDPNSPDKTAPDFADVDGDGLPAIIDPNDNNVDSDGDRYTDAYELLNGTDPLLATSKPSLGDSNGNGTITAVDVTLLKQVLQGLNPPSAIIDNVDTTLNGRLGATDVTRLKQYLIDPSRKIP
jgi:hypothetical protein